MAKFALITWTKGPDMNAISIVETKWIVDFDSTDLTKCYLVECRSNSRKPANGWPVESAKVLQISDKLAPLKQAERQMTNPSQDMSRRPIKKPKRLAEDEEADGESRETSPSTSGKEIKKRATLETSKNTEKEILLKLCPASPAPTPCTASESSDDGRLKELHNQVSSLRKENSKLRNMVIREIPTLLADMRAVLNSRSPETSSGSHTEDMTTPCKTKDKSEVKLGDDSNVTVSSHCWETAKGQATASGMTRVLLLGLFPTEVLLKSNLTGGKNKFDPTAERREALDKEKLDALIGVVLKLHPTSKTSEIRKVINMRICELRHQLKTKSKE